MGYYFTWSQIIKLHIVNTYLKSIDIVYVVTAGLSMLFNGKF